MIRVGTAGWSYADWIGAVYPRQRSRGFQQLAFLSKFIDCVEVNSTFYSLPQAEMARGWLQQVNEKPGFQFLAKLHQGFTHAPLNSEENSDLCAERFNHGIRPLADSGQLAAVLAQFPISFHPTTAAWRRLDSVRERFSQSPLVLELRHESWFSRENLNRLEGLNCSIAELDLPYSKSHAPTDRVMPGALGYLRLHGRNAEAWFDSRSNRDQKYDYLYSPAEIDSLASRAERQSQAKAHTYVITNNHFAGKAVANALELMHALHEGRVLAPAELVSRYPRLESMAQSLGQNELF